MRKLGVLFITLLCLTACDKKGDGSHFYAEPIYKNKNLVYCTHHSTLDCPEIKEGVMRDGYIYEKEKNFFAPNVWTTRSLTNGINGMSERRLNETSKRL